MALQTLVAQGVFIIEASRWHSDTPHWGGLLWTGDQPVAETSVWQHVTLRRDRQPCHRWDSKPQSQQAISRRLTPQNARPPASAGFHIQMYNSVTYTTQLDTFVTAACLPTSTHSRCSSRSTDVDSAVYCLCRSDFIDRSTRKVLWPFKDEAQTALFKDPVRTVQ